MVSEGEPSLLETTSERHTPGGIASMFRRLDDSMETGEMES